MSVILSRRYETRCGYTLARRLLVFVLIKEPLRVAAFLQISSLRFCMKRLLVSLALILGLLVSQSLADQPASKIVDRYKKAAGGKSVARVKSTFMTGSVKGSDGTAGRFSLQTSAPNNLRLDLELGETKVSECYNGKSAWRLDARGLRTL